MSFNPFDSNNQKQGQSSGGGGIFSGINTNSNSLFGNNNNNTNTNTKGLFGNILNNNPNTNNSSSNESKAPPLFGNIPNSNNNLLFGNKQNSNTNTSNNNLFGNLNSNAPKPALGIFQNNNINDNNKPKESTGFMFGAPSNITNTQSVQNTQAEKKKEENNFSLFSGPNINTQTQEKPKENDKPELFSNITNTTTAQSQVGINKPAGGLSLFGAPKEETKKENTNNPVNQTQSQTQKKENDENNKLKNTLFGNNINIQSTNAAGNLFGNSDNKNEQKQTQKTNTNPIQNQASNPINNNTNVNNNKNAQNQNNNNPQVNVKNDNINKLNIKIPEKPFDLSFCNSKELEEYEKNQIMHKTSKEIIEDFKNTLLNQKAKYKQCVKNTREFEKKLMGIIEITQTNALISEINEKKGGKIIQKINSINYQSKNLENILTNFNDKLGQTLSPYKDNVMNSDKIFLNQSNSEKFKFYENFSQTSDKCYAIENSINEIEQNLEKKEKEMEEKDKNNKDGFWIERNKGIFVNQNEINSLFSECYDGLTNLKSMQDNIDRKYEMLKLKLMKNIGNNKYMNNNNNYNFNDLY